MVTIQHGVLYLPQNSGVVLTTQVDNVNPGTGPVLYARSLAIGGGISGFSGGEENRLLLIQPTRQSPIEDVNFFHNDTGSSVGNRLLNKDAIDQVSAFWGSCGLYIYDDVDDFWKQVG